MNTKQIEIFMVMAQKCHFSRTAAILGETQPTITRNIKLLEDELGVKLFERNRRNCKITDAGKQWAKTFRKIQKLIDKEMEK